MLVAVAAAEYNRPSANEERSEYSCQHGEEKKHDDKMSHREVVMAVNGLVEYLRSERKSAPGVVLVEAYHPYGNRGRVAALGRSWNVDCDPNYPP